MSIVGVSLHEAVRALARSSAQDLTQAAYAAGREPPPESWSTSIFASAAALRALGREADADDIVRGTRHAALADDPSGEPRLHARTVDGTWIVDGTAPLVVGGRAAELLVVSAVVGDTGQVVAGVVDTTSEGVVRTVARALGDDGVADVHLAGCVLGDATVDVEPPLAAVRWLATLAAAAELAGVAAAALEHAVAYVTRREQFGRPIATFQVVQHRLCDALVDVVAASDAVADAAARVDDGAPATATVARAKVIASESARRVVASAQQVHGGVGYYEDSPLPRLTRRAIALSRRAGDPGALRSWLAANPASG